MDGKNIIIMLLIAVIIILAAVIGVTFLQHDAKEASKIAITSANVQYEGGNISMELTDLNKRPIFNDVVNIAIVDNEGNVVVDEFVKTDSNGKASLDLNLENGEYIVNVTYSGNDEYEASNATQELTIEEEVVQATVSQSTASPSSSQSSVREEDQVTSDGWDPKEHEVSREQLDDGYERVNYDDGYMRVVDSDGNVVSYGY